MQENKNAPITIPGEGRGNVCIDTMRVMDCCRDRDCFEDTRVYLSAAGQDTLANATNVRVRDTRILWAYVGIDEVPFNRGFYQVTVRYYIDVECEACLGIGRSQTVHGLAVLEKEVILYGGEGSVQSYSSGNNGYCAPIDPDAFSTRDPIAVVETATPLVLGTKVVDCGQSGRQNELCEIPDHIRGMLDGAPVLQPDGARLYVSFGIFSVIRIKRPAQIIVQGCDYSVPEKECVAAQSDENPCRLFHSMPFPTSEFKTEGATETPRSQPRFCGCKNGAGT